MLTYLSALVLLLLAAPISTHANEFGALYCNEGFNGYPSEVEYNSLKDRIKTSSVKIITLQDKINAVVVGHNEITTRLLIGLLTNSHILIEGLPGFAKTTIAKGLASGSQGKFARTQFMPDLLPSDIVGSSIYNPKTGLFEITKGPIFSNFYLADEINRAPGKAQSALLEAMAEGQVTIAGQTYRLEPPFLVIATQNPIEQTGVYPLTEAQLDRFSMKLFMNHLDPSSTRKMLEMKLAGVPPTVAPIVTQEEILAAQAMIKKIVIHPNLIDYVVALVDATWHPETYQLTKIKPKIAMGVSPRAAIAIVEAARAHAFLQGRADVSIEDIKAIAADIMAHRLKLTVAAELERVSQTTIINEIIKSVPVKP